MKKYLFILSIVALSLASCKSDNDEMSYWGEVSYYDKFWWRDYVPDTIERVLNIGFNDDAIAELHGDIVFDLYYRLSTSDYVKTSLEDVELYVNGLKSPDNTIRVRICDEQKQQHIKIGIVLTKKILHSEDIDRDYYFVLKVIENPGIDRINDYLLNIGEQPLFVVEKDSRTPMIIRVRHVSNKLQVWVKSILSFIGILLICVLILWFVIIKGISYPKIKVSIDINGEYYLHKPRNRYRMIVLCDGNIKRQSFLNRLFTGEIYYSVNEMWSNGPVYIKPSGKTVRIKIGENYNIKPYNLTLEKETEYKISNVDTKQNVNLVLS